MNTNVEEIIRELDTVSQVAWLCGGTMSSGALKTCLSLLNGDTPLTENQSQKLHAYVELWRAQLKAHNNQKEKFIEYDVETGFQKKTT